MRYAIISDIHGNLHSLELVLTDLHQTNVDHVICLGDVASLGPQPREVVTLLRELNIPIIMGNHDNYLLNPQLTENHHPWLRAAELWCLTQLSADDLNFLRSFPAKLNYMLNAETSMLCFHGSPRSNEEFLFPTALPDILDEVFADQTAKILVGGHTHVQMVRQHKDVTFLNPGSVGTPFEFPMRGSEPHAIRRAEYAILDMTDGRLTFNLHQLSIDFEYLARITRASGMPDVDFWLSTWSV